MNYFRDFSLINHFLSIIYIDLLIICKLKLLHFWLLIHYKSNGPIIVDKIKLKNVGNLLEIQFTFTIF